MASSKLLLLFGSIALLLLAGLSAWVALGPIPISSVGMILNAISGAGIDSPEATTWRSRIEAPDGFSVSVYAADLPMIRFLVFTSSGDLLVSRPRAGEVMLLGRDANADGRPDTRTVLLEDLTRPQGLALRQGWLYIAESNAIGRVAFDEKRGALVGAYERIVEDLPDAGNHWGKTIGFGPDDKLYVSIGSSCNVCQEQDERRATIMQFAADGSNGRLFATGLRNAVGFDWAPWNAQMYATDNGRDWLGDDFPPCELNRVVAGGFYGWPYINGFGQLDPDMGKGKQALLASAISPVMGFGAHQAPLAIHFIRDGAGFPERSALVALHGSWNRRTPAGYKVELLVWQADGSVQSQDFLTGFELGGDIIGRPVDVVQGPRGDIYVSDDYAGTIYRVSYGLSGG